MIIGTITVPAGTLRKQYECAAWYRTFVYDTQTVELRKRGTFVDYVLDGRVTYEYLPSLFGGVATGGGTIGACDYVDTHTVSTYGYSIAESVAAGSDSIRLADGLAVDSFTMDHPVFCRGYHYTGQNDGPFPAVAACDHPNHVDRRGRDTGHTDARGSWPRHPNAGYVPDETRSVTHHRIVETVGR